MSREHAAALNPPPPRQLSREEILALPDDVLTPELLAQAGVFDSKYGQTDADDPLLQAGKQFVRKNPIRR
jgi:hypothetical protein